MVDEVETVPEGKPSQTRRDFQLILKRLKPNGNTKLILAILAALGAGSGGMSLWDFLDKARAASPKEAAPEPINKELIEYKIEELKTRQETFEKKVDSKFDSLQRWLDDRLPPKRRR